MRRKRDYTPLSWEEYFESTKDVYVNGKNVSFRQRCVFVRTESSDGETGELCAQERNPMTSANMC